MNQSKISVRYAKAIFELAKEKNKLSAVRQDMMVLLETCENEKVFADFLDNPVIKPSAKKSVFEYIFKSTIDNLTNDFFGLLIKNKRENFLKDIARYFQSLYRKELNIQRVQIITSESLASDTRASIIQKIKQLYNSEIELQEIVDKSLIGGFVLRTEDQQFDASIKNKLSIIKQNLSYTAL